MAKIWTIRRIALRLFQQVVRRPDLRLGPFLRLRRRRIPAHPGLLAGEQTHLLSTKSSCFLWQIISDDFDKF